MKFVLMEHSITEIMQFFQNLQSVVKGESPPTNIFLNF